MKRTMLTDVLIIAILCLIVVTVFVAVYPEKQEKVEEPIETPIATVEPTTIPTPTPTPTPEPTPIPTPEPTPYVFYSENIPLSAELQAVLYDSCLENEIDIYIALGLIEYESNFQTDLDNGKVYGICQLSHKYFPSGLSPADNIRYGMNFLGKLLKQNGSYPVALTIYNAGHDTGSRTYANIVISKAEKWRNLV